MSDLVTYRVPDEHGYTLVHQHSAIVPDVGEKVFIDIEYSEVYDFLVASRRYNLNTHGEDSTQVVIDLTEHPDADRRL